MDESPAATNDNSAVCRSNSTNTVDVYLKKHKLDLTVLPNKKMIKLCDLAHSNSNQIQTSDISGTNSLLKNSTIDSWVNQSSSSVNNNEICNQSLSQSFEEEDFEEDYEFYDEEEFLDEENDEEDDDENDDEEREKINDQSESYLNKSSLIQENNLENDESPTALANESSNETNQKRTRKKREPSLKLQQKLSNEDLELIVSCVRNRQAQVFKADVKKDNYIDKILRVKLIGNDANEKEIALSNGNREALLKKSMFPKDLNTLFETFANSLCGQDYLIDENGQSKPTLKCLVEDCAFKSCSEAEIMRHIKRHLAQDGYTCSTCNHQFASMTNLQRHLRIHAGNIGKEMQCPHCDYKASTITHIKRHMAHKHLERSLPCPHCSFMGATNAELKIHMARKHLELTGKNPLFLPKYLRKDYQCSICKEQYNDFKEYQTHMYEHTSGSNRFQCSECAYNCKNYSKLKRHMLYHTGARNFECKICGNKFFQMEHLKRHMLSIHNLLPSTNATSATTNLSPNAAQIYSNGSTGAGSSQQTKSNKKSQIISVVNNSSNNNYSDNDCSLQLNDNQTNDQLSVVFNQPVETSTLANPTSNLYNISQQQVSQPPSENQELMQPCYKVTSKCVYKCQQCEFSTMKLFALNDHVINEHYRNGDVYENQQESVSNNLDDIDDDDFEDEDVNYLADEELIDINDVQDENSLDADNNSNQITEKILTCAFCAYKTDKKPNLKRHLQNNHSSQMTAPILLSNDPIMFHPNTRFQCGTCRRYVNDLNNYIKHMNEKHKIQVYIIDSNDSMNIPQEQLLMKDKNESTLNLISAPVNCVPTPTLPEPVNTSNNNNNNSTTVTINPNLINHNNQRTPQNVTNRTNKSSTRQLKYYNHFSTLSQQHHQSQQTTVRINPLFLKRNFQSNNSPINNNQINESFKKDNVINQQIQIQQPQQQQQQIYTQQNTCFIDQNFNRLDSNQTILNQAISDASNQLILVNNHL